MIFRFAPQPTRLRIYRVTVFPSSCRPWGFAKASRAGRYCGWLFWFFGIAVSYDKGDRATDDPTSPESPPPHSATAGR